MKPQKLRDMKKIDWNPDQINATEQEMEFRLRFAQWPFEKKWNYLMRLFKMGKPKSTVVCKRKIEW